MRVVSSVLRWACATIAPWCLASGLLMSFTASAGIEPASGGSRALRETSRKCHSYFVATPGAIDLALLIGPDIIVNRLQSPWTEAPSTDLAEDGVAGVPPRSDLKRDAGTFPSVERTEKGDPLIQLRPVLGRRAPADRDDLA